MVAFGGVQASKDVSDYLKPGNIVVVECAVAKTFSGMRQVTSKNVLLSFYTSRLRCAVIFRPKLVRSQQFGWSEMIQVSASSVPIQEQPQIPM